MYELRLELADRALRSLPDQVKQPPLSFVICVDGMLDWEGLAGLGCPRRWEGWFAEWYVVVDVLWQDERAALVHACSWV